MNGLTTIESKRRAVAPIIATLLMVAIAVVGGILIFVFTQGFFADEQVVGPTVDNIRIVGYSASDEGDTIQEVTSADTLTCAEGTADNVLSTDDCVTIFIENLGDKPVAIQAIRLFGTTYTPQATVSAGACPQTAGEFAMFSTSSSAALSILEPNTQATLCLQYSDTNNVKAGRTIPIQVETSNGQSSQINIINGATRGQQ